MTRLDVSLLGPMQVARAGQPLAGFNYDKVRGLLAYLVIENDRPWRRETLAGLLWPDQDERAARHSLSQALFTLRRLLDERDAVTPLLLVTSDTVQLNPAADVWCDLHAFERLLTDCERHPHRDASRCRACARRIEQAVGLYRGDLLDGFALPDSPMFDDWLLIRRERAQALAISALGQLAGFLETRGAFEQAARVTRHLLTLDPWREDALRQLMRLLTWTGQRTAAIEYATRFERRLADELAVALEDETLALLGAIRSGRELPLRQPTPPLRRREIPVQVTAFVGREQELSELTNLLLDGTCRLITLTGPGGIGKTRLAVQAAGMAAGSFADGVVFVPMAGLSSAALVPAAICSLLDIQSQTGIDEWATLLHWLRERELLLVLDNAEHLLDAAGLIGDILDRAPDVQLLMTSRERLNLHGEWVVALDGLELPQSSRPQPSSAEQLFIERARQVVAGFQPNATEQAAIARLCLLVEGMPLALEIAAGWLPVLRCVDIVAEVERSLGFLETTRRDAEPRHRSIHAVFDRSWELLGEPEQRAFRRLAIFRGGIQRHAVERITGASLPVLSSLVAKSLLRRTPDGHYELHELIRQYAAERLAAEPGEAEVVRERHCAYYMKLIADRADDLRTSRQDEAIAELEVELENIHVAWATAVEQHRVEMIAEAAYGLWLFCEITGRNGDLHATMSLAIAALEASNDSQLALGRLLILYGSIFVRTANAETGDATVARGLELLRRLDATADIGLGLNFQASYAHWRQEYERESALLRESISCSEQAGERWAMAYSLNDLGLATLELGDIDEAVRLHEASLAIFRDIGDKRGISFALHNLGIGARQRGDDSANTLLTEALAIRREIRHVWGTAVTLIELGVVARENGDDEQAIAYFRDGIQVANDIQATPAILRGLAELSVVLARDGQQQRGATLLSSVLHHPGAEPQVRSLARSLLASVIGADAPDQPASAATFPSGSIEATIDVEVAALLGQG